MASSCPEEVLFSLWGTDLWEKNPAQSSRPSPVRLIPQRYPQQPAASSMEHLLCTGMGSHTDPDALPYSQGPSVGQSCMNYPMPWVKPWTPFDTTFWLGHLFSADSAPSLGPWGTSGFDPQLGRESPTFPDFLSPLEGSSDSGALIPGRGIQLSLPSAVHPRFQREPQQLAAASLGIHEHLPCMGMGTHTDPDPLPYSQGPSVGQSCMGYPVPWVNPWTPFDTTFWLGHLFSTDSAPSLGPWGTSGFDPQLGGESPTFPDFLSLLEPLRPSSSVPPGFSPRPPCPNPSVPPVFPLKPLQPSPLVPSDSPPSPLCPSSVVPPDLITRTPRSGRTPGRLPLQAGKAGKLQANSSMTICQALPAELTSRFSMLASMGPSSPELLSMPPSPITDRKADVCRPRARKATRPPCKARRRLFDP